MGKGLSACGCMGRMHQYVQKSMTDLSLSLSLMPFSLSCAPSHPPLSFMPLLHFILYPLSLSPSLSRFHARCFLCRVVAPPPKKRQAPQKETPHPTHTYTHRHTNTQRHTETQTDKQTDRQTDRQTHTHTHMLPCLLLHFMLQRLHCLLQ